MLKRKKKSCRRCFSVLPGRRARPGLEEERKSERKTSPLTVHAPRGQLPDRKQRDRVGQQVPERRVRKVGREQRVRDRRRARREPLHKVQRHQPAPQRSQGKVPQEEDGDVDRRDPPDGAFRGGGAVPRVARSSGERPQRRRPCLCKFRRPFALFREFQAQDRPYHRFCYSVPVAVPLLQLVGRRGEAARGGSHGGEEGGPGDVGGKAAQG